MDEPNPNPGEDQTGPDPVRGPKADGPADADAGSDGPPPAPTPVRDLMPGTSDSVAEDEIEPSAAPEVSIEFQAENESWVAVSGGRTRSGTAPDSGAMLLLILFRRAADPEDRVRREVWTAARSLEELSPVQLAELLGRSRPFRDVDPSGGEDASEARGRGRRRGGKGRRTRGH